MANIRIYLALQEIENGKVNFRKWSPDCPRNLPGGPFQQQSIGAHLWIQRMVFRCARDGVLPVVKWDDPLKFTDDFLKKIPPFEVVSMESTEEMDFMDELRQGGFEQANFITREH